MPRIQNTELDYDDTDAKVLDFYLGGNTETKEEWAQRVWDCCRRKSEGEDLPRVYSTKPGQTWQQRARELWENKKQRRKAGIMRELNAKNEDLPNIDKNPNYKIRNQKDAETASIVLG